MNASAQEIALRYTLNTLISELRRKGEHFDRLDGLYSEFFFIQNDHIRFRHRLGDLSIEERNRQWAEVDQQETEWEARLEEWREDRFRLQKAISELQVKIRELATGGLRVAA